MLEDTTSTNEMDSSNHDENAPEEALMADAPANKEGPTPRLLITKMELENFKSYMGVKQIGPFHKCFSAVVGPNGSGKSNVIDAMLFVFGKRAKKLRLNKVSELIHKSDAVKDNPPTSARVSVFFQEIIDTGSGDTDYEVVPNTERVVTRVAHKNNSSTYKLDGKNCSFRDVAAFLDSKGIDLDNNRFLILQGEVEMISMMPPKGKNEDDDGLLEYLEDIIGSSKYVEDTNLAAQKVDQLTEQRQEKLNRVKAVEKEKDNLAGAKQEAEALLSKERDIRRKRNMLYQIHSMKETKTIDKLTEKKDAMAAKLKTEKEKENTSKQRVQELEEAFLELDKQHAKVKEELKITKDEFAAFERRDIKLRADIKHGKAQLKKAATKVTSEAKKEEDATEKGKEAEESIPDIEESIVELTERKSKEDDKLEEIDVQVKGITQGLRAQLEEKTQELAPVNQELAVFKASLDTAETEVKLLEDSTTRAKERLATSEEELASLDEKQQSKRDELTKCESDLANARKRLVDNEKEEQVLGNKENALAEKSRDLMARSEEAKAALQSGGNGQASAAVTGILKAARSGGELSKFGILGRLGDLCTVTAKYDVAVSTASGSLNHIVVQTTAGAQKCLEFLRKHNLGRANFIPLDKMKKGAHDRQVETPEGAPRLFDLITPGNFAVTPALFLAVGNTLVAPDIDTATRWAFDFGKRWRVVTVDGNLIESSGTMAGGGKSAKRGGMRVANAGTRVNIAPIDQSSAEDCKRLEQEAGAALELVQQCRQRRRDLTNESRALRKSVKALEVRVPKLSMEIQGFDTSRQELTKLIPELRTKCELTPEEDARLQELLKKVDACKSDMSSCEKLAAKLAAEVARLQKEILDAGGAKLKKQQKTCEKLLSELNDAEKSLNSAKVAITSNQKAAAKAKKQMESAEQQKQECSDLLDAKKAEIKELEEKAQSVMEAYNKVMQVEADKSKERDAAKQECDDLKKSHAAARCAEIELQGQVEAAERQLAESTHNRKRWENEIKKLMTKEKEDDDEFDFSEGEEENDEGDESDEEEPKSKEELADSEDVEMDEAEENDDVAEKEPKEQNTKSSSKSSLPTFTFATLEKYNVDDIKGDIDKLESEHNTLSKNANMGAIDEYKKKEADYLSRIGELDVVTEERNACRKEHEELRRKRLEMFMDGFGKITLKLKEMYQMITLGGDAELELVDSLDPFSEGIVFSVRPPKKSWKNISNLSGGEKTLSSLALVFALHHYKPTPLYVMDEIDAALDFKNVSIVANYIKERTKNAQFIIISLRNNMFELADRLVGIYKTNNATKSISIDPKAFGISHSQNGASITPSRALVEKTNSQLVRSPAQGVRKKMTYNTGDDDEQNTQGIINA